MNVYKADRLSLVTDGPDWGADAPISLNSGKVVDYFKTPTGFSAEYTGATRKTGANLITVSRLGSDAGFNDVGGLAFTYGAESTSGAGSNNFVHVMQTQTIGFGVRFEIPISARYGSYHSKMLFTIWDVTNSVRQTEWAASILGDPNAVSVLDGIGGAYPFNPAKVNQKTMLTYWSEKPGTTLRVDMRRNGGSMGNWGWFACKLEMAPIPRKHIRGITRRMMGFAR